MAIYQAICSGKTDYSTITLMNPTEEFKPGQVISPQNTSVAAPPPPTEPPTGPTGAPQPERPAEPPTPPPPPTPLPDPKATEEVANAGWQFRSEAAGASSQQIPSGLEPPISADADVPDGLSWTASEFITHEKSVGWYGLLAATAIVAAVLVYLVTKDKISTGIVILAAIALGVFAARKPQIQTYSLLPEGLQIGSKVYSFQEFKTFSVIEEGTITSVVFMPFKRFMPPLTIYVAPELEDKVVNFLSVFMPFEQHKADAVDSLLRRIRF